MTRDADAAQASSLEETYPRLRSRVVVLAVRRFGMQVQEAEDAIDDAFARLVGRVRSGEQGGILRPSPDAERMLAAYLLNASRFRQLDLVTRRREVTGSERVLLELVDQTADPAEIVVQRERAAQLRSALENLDAPYAELFRLLLGGLSLAEIGRRPPFRPNSVYKQFERGAAQLRQLLAA